MTGSLPWTLLLLATWAFTLVAYGGVEPWMFSLASLLLVAACLRESGVRLRVPAGIAIAAALYFLPLPVAILRLVSPLQAGLLEQHGLTWGRLALDTEGAVLELVKIAGYSAAGLLAMRAVRDERSRRLLIGGVIGLAAVAAAYGFLAWITNSTSLLFWGERHETHCMTGPFINHNHFAGLLEMTIPLVLGGLWALGPADNRRRVLLMGLAVAMTLCLALSFSRAGILSFLLATGIVLAAMRASRRVILPVGALVLLGMAGSLWLGEGGALVRRMEDTDMGSRVGQWGRTLRMIGEHPVGGIGPGGFRTVFPAYKGAIPSEFHHAHNDYLEAAAEFGVPLFLAAIAGLALWFRRVAREPDGPSRPLAAALLAGVTALVIHSLADFNLRIPSNGILFSILIGAGLGLRSPGPAPDRLLPGRILAACGALAIGGVFVGEIQGGTLPWHVTRRLDHATAQEAPAALAELGDVVRRSPVNHKAHYAEAAFHFMRNEGDACDRELEMAVACGSNQRDLRLKAGRLWWRRARAAGRADLRDRAMESFRVAAELDPDGSTLEQVLETLEEAPLVDLVRITPGRFVRRLGEMLVRTQRRSEVVPAVNQLSLPRTESISRELELLAQRTFAAEWYPETVGLLEKVEEMGAARKGEPFVMLGYSLFRMGQIDRARGAFEKELERHPTSINAHRGLGQLLFSLGDFSAALPHFQKALRMSPRERSDGVLVAECAVKAGNPAIAESAWEALLAWDPKDRGALLRLAGSLIESHQAARARARILKFLDGAGPDEELKALLRKCDDSR